MFARRVAFCGALWALIAVTASGLQARDEQLPGWFDLEVPGGASTLERLGLSLEERAFTLPVLARMLYDREQRAANSDFISMLAGASRSPSDSDTINIPAPLDEKIWRDILPAVKAPAVTPLFFRLTTDRNALLLATGLAATSDGARQFFARDRDLLRVIYREGAGPFAIVARRLEIQEGRVLVPGGPGAEAAWQALVGVAPSRASQFIRALVTKDEGRLAWYYDVIAGLDPQTLAAAWPAVTPPAERATALYPAFRDPDPQWRAFEQPFRRSPIDAWAVATFNRAADGQVVSALPQPTWEVLFSTSRPNRSQITRSLQDARPGVSLPWLVRETLSPLVRERRVRHEMFRLVQRVFADARPEQLSDVALALGAMRQHRALLFALERMQVTNAATWAAVVQAAQHVSDDADDRHESIVSFQSTVALLERMRHVRTLDPATTDRLLTSLSDAVRADDKVSATLASWIVTTLVRAVPPLVQPDEFTGKTAYESTILQALAGPGDRTLTRVMWEGLEYVADPVGAEHERLRRMRTLLPSPGLDAALASGRPKSLAEALTALVYATALGDPEGPASLSPDVASRHEFGFGATALLRDELPWAPPEERQGNGPWHVQGSVIGLDLAMSRLFMRRIADQQMPLAPTLTLNDLATLTRTGVAMVASELTDADRDAIAAAIRRGRDRVHAARNLDEWRALAAESAMPPSTMRLLPWIASRQREALPSLFSLRDLMWLGKPALPHTVLDRWGVSGGSLDGRSTLAMPNASSWEDYAGRTEIGQVATQVPDLTLTLVEATARLRLPAQLVPSLLAFALEDYFHEVRARFADDWPRLVRHAAAVPETRIQDYVAALAGGGPLRAQ